MKRSSREITRNFVEGQREAARARKLLLEEQEAKKAAAVQAAIAKNNSKKSPTEQWSLPQNEFWKIIEKKAPRLFDNDYIYKLNIISLLEHHRSIVDWEPRGKGKDTIFNSLCDHLLAKFKTPSFIWSAFWELGFHFRIDTKPDSEGRYIDIECSPILQAIIRISRGDSFFKMCKSGDFPVALTQKQCHQFLSSNSDISFMWALRRTQIQTWGGDNRLLKAWMNHEFGKKLGSIIDERWFDSVIAWFSKNPMLDLDQFDQIIDYIINRRRQDKNFSMKGRSAMAVIKAMEEWHQDLAKRQITKGKEYKSSGFKSGHYEYSHRLSSGNYEQFHYNIDEILNSKELHAEGKILKHCVLSYSSSIENGCCSIWSMKINGERKITIEVRNKYIVQARGSCNRKSSAEEFKIMQRWASENGLGIQLPSWG